MKETKKNEIIIKKNFFLLLSRFKKIVEKIERIEKKPIHKSSEIKGDKYDYYFECNFCKRYTLFKKKINYNLFNKNVTIINWYEIDNFKICYYCCSLGFEKKLREEKEYLLNLENIDFDEKITKNFSLKIWKENIYPIFLNIEKKDFLILFNYWILLENESKNSEENNDEKNDNNLQTNINNKRNGILFFSDDDFWYNNNDNDASIKPEKYSIISNDKNLNLNENEKKTNDFIDIKKYDWILTNSLITYFLIFITIFIFFWLFLAKKKNIKEKAENN